MKGAFQTLCDFLFVGFFGQAAIRMLRETWEGTVNVTTDPASGQQQVKPVGADLLAQEIFSMLNDSTPQENNAPVTINQPDGGGGLTINASSASGSAPGLNVLGGDVHLNTSGNVTVGQPSSATSTGAQITLTGSRVNLPPLGYIDLPATSWNPLQPGSLPKITLMSSAGPVPGQAYIGKVVGTAAGGGYTMQLAGVSGNVTAYPGQTGTGYVVPNNTWAIVVAVDDGSGNPVYYFQPYPYATQTINGALQQPATLSNVIVALQNLGLFVNATSWAPPTISGPTQGLHGGGALANLIIGLNNLGIIVNSTSDSPQSVGGPSQVFLGGGYLYNLGIAMQNLGLISGLPSDGRQTITGSRSGNPALTNLLTALNNAALIIDSTTP